MAWSFPFVLLLLLTTLTALSSGDLIVVTPNQRLTLENTYAAFSASIDDSDGLRGVPVMANPIDACGPLQNTVVEGETWFAVAVRGNCEFTEKTMNAQSKGASAIIVYDDTSGDLIVMNGDSSGIAIVAIFISKFSGSLLFNATSQTNVTATITPESDNFFLQLWPTFLMPLIFVLVVSVFMVGLYTFCRRRQMARLRRENVLPEAAIPSLPSRYYKKLEGEESDTCAICLEEFNNNDEQKVLPCNHAYHSECIVPWLTMRRRVCPICKREILQESQGEMATTLSNAENGHSERALNSLSRNNSVTDTSLQRVGSRNRNSSTERTPLIRPASFFNYTSAGENSDSNGNNTMDASNREAAESANGSGRNAANSNSRSGRSNLTNNDINASQLQHS